MKINNKWRIILESLFQYVLFTLYTVFGLVCYIAGLPLLSIYVILCGIGMLIWSIAYDVTSMKHNLVIFLNKVEEEEE